MGILLGWVNDDDSAPEIPQFGGLFFVLTHGGGRGARFKHSGSPFGFCSFTFPDHGDRWGKVSGSPPADP